LLFLKPEVAYNILRDPETVVLKPSHPRKCPTSFSFPSSVQFLPVRFLTSPEAPSPGHLGKCTYI
jgi:hypothetical protein